MQFKAEVLDKKKLTEKITELNLKLIEPASIQFKAGQFVQFLIDSQKRSYSIISVPKQNDGISFCVDISPMGVGSNFVENLKKGDELLLEGPLGVFVVKPADKDLLFVATGAGIAPFKSMILNLLDSGFDKNVVLLFGLRAEPDIFYFDFFERLSQKHKNFNFIATLSQPSENWQGQKGRVTAYLQQNYEQYKNCTAYICGSIEMVKDVRALLIEKGTQPTDIKIEIFT
jgi:NAD(P)H-flavin reductase